MAEPILEFASLGSGSKGNATLVRCGATILLVDCGFGVKETSKRLEKLGLTGHDLSAILVTHEHGDHTKGVGPVARKFKLPVYMTPGTHVSRDYGVLAELCLIKAYQPFSVGLIDVTPVAVPHDAREPAQYVFNCDGLKLGVLTDIGSITPHVLEAYADCQALLVEANHDLEMLAAGPYPPSLQARVSGPWGHLNNYQAAEFLRCVAPNPLQHLVIGHLSEKNNCLSRVKLALYDVIENHPNVLFASQSEGFDFLSLQSTEV